MRGSTNKSPIKLSAAENKFTWWFVYEWEKPTRQKPHQVILRSPLPKFHYCHHSQNSTIITVPYINLQLNFYPNTQLDLFCSDNFSFWCMAPITWLTNCMDLSTQLQSPTREGCWLQSSSVHPDDEDQEDAWS